MDGKNVPFKTVAAFICANATSLTSHIGVSPRYGNFPLSARNINVVDSPSVLVFLGGPTIKLGLIVAPVILLGFKFSSCNNSQNFFSAIVLEYL